MEREEDDPAVAILEEFDFIHPRGCVWGASDQCFLWGFQSGEVHDQRTAHVFGGVIQLLQDWHKIFLSVQSPTLSPDYLECSHRYRATLEAFLLSETTKIKAHDQLLLQSLRRLNFSLEHYAMHLKLLEDLKSLWHITDMLFVDPARNITASLIDWVQRRVEPPEIPLDKNHRPAVNHSQFWANLARLALLGHYGLVVDALQSAGVLIPPEVRQTLQELFQQDPSLLPSLSEGEYRSKFQTWQEDVTAAQEQLHVGREGPGLVLAVLRGDSYVLEDLATCWEERFIAQVRFCRPYVFKDGLWRLAQSCGDPPQPNLGLDLLCCPAEQQEKVLQKTLVQIVQLGCPRWLTTHLLDLLTHAIPHRRKRQDVWRERELLEYGTSIMQHPQLWELAVDYFLACPSKGHSALRALIEVQPLRNEEEASRMLLYCDKFGFPDLRQGICNQMANDCLKRQPAQYAEATRWMCESGNAQRLCGLSLLLCDMFMDSVESLEVKFAGTCAECGEALQQAVRSRDSSYHRACLKQTALTAISGVVAEVEKDPENFNLHYLLPFLLHFQQLQEALHSIELLQGEASERERAAATLTEQRAVRAEKEHELETLVRECLAIVVRALAMRVAPRRARLYLLQVSVELLQHASTLTPTPTSSTSSSSSSSSSASSSLAMTRCVLNQTDTFKLMSCLDELALSHQQFCKTLSAQENNKIKVIRLGLVRNLARAVKSGC